MIRFGEPSAVQGQCNATLHIGDNYGDNHATMRCHLEPGHDGPHRETYDRSGEVAITWHCDDRDECGICAAKMSRAAKYTEDGSSVCIGCADSVKGVVAP